MENAGKSIRLSWLIKIVYNMKVSSIALAMSCSCRHRCRCRSSLVAVIKKKLKSRTNGDVKETKTA